METPRPSSSLGRRFGALKDALNRNVLLLVLGGSVLNVPIGFVFVAFPVYLGRVPTVPPGFEGVPLTVSGLLAVATMIPLGMVADRAGRRLMLALGSFAAAGAFVLLSLLDSFNGILLASAILGLAEGFYFSVWNALLADSSTPETRTTVFGVSFFAAGLAMAAGSLVGITADVAIQGGLTPQEAYQPLFLLLGLLVLPVPLLIPFLRLVPRERGDQPWLPQRSKQVIGRFVVANLLIGFGAGLIIPLLSLWFFKQFGVGETFTGPLYAISSVVNAFAFLIAPALAKRLGMVRVIVVAQSVATLLLFTMPFTPLFAALGLPSAAALFIVRNALMNMTWPVASAFLMGAVHPDERATASGVTGAFFRAPQASATSLGGYLLDVNLALPFYVTTAFYALGTAAFWRFFRGHDASEGESTT